MAKPERASNRLSAAASPAASGSPTDICTPPPPPRRDLRRPHLPAPPARSAGRSRGAPADTTVPAGQPLLRVRPPALAPPHPHAPTFRIGARNPTLLLASRVSPTGSRSSGEVSPSAGQTRELLISSSPWRPCLALWVAWFQTCPDFLGCCPASSPDRTPGGLAMCRGRSWSPLCGQLSESPPPAAGVPPRERPSRGPSAGQRREAVCEPRERLGAGGGGVNTRAFSSAFGSK